MSKNIHTATARVLRNTTKTCEYVVSQLEATKAKIKDMKKSMSLVTTMHWDMLWVIGQLDLGITAACRGSMEKFLTDKLRNQIRSEISDPSKKKLRDSSNALLIQRINKVMSEESNTNLRLNQVMKGGGGGYSFGNINRRGF